MKEPDDLKFYLALLAMLILYLMLCYLGGPITVPW